MERQVENQISCIVLAAGQSRRMGANKLSLPIGNLTLLEKTLQQLAPIKFYQRILVINPEQDFSTLAQKYNFKAVINTEFRSGLHSSIRHGIKNAAGSLYLITLADQPYMTTQHYLNFLKFSADNLENFSLFRPMVSSCPGNPTLVHHKFRTEILLQADNDSGCRYLFEKYNQEFQPFQSSEIAYICDIDTQEDYQKCLT